LAKLAELTGKAVWKWYLTSYSDIQQFLGNSLVDLVGEDIVALRTAGEEDTVSNILSRYFAYFFLVIFASAVNSTVSSVQNFHIEKVTLHRTKASRLVKCNSLPKSVLVES
jgi:hypothetical protein